jgi:hypothetical protein
MEKETLEKAAKEWVNNRFTKQVCGDESYPDIYANKEGIVESHILFAKWQAEKMYSEEDILRFGAFMQQRHTGVKESFEQFKKK